MQLRSTRRHLTALQTEWSLLARDVSTVSGADAACLVSELTPLLNVLSSLVSSLSARAVAGGSADASWVAATTGVSQKQAWSELAVQKQLDSLPDVKDAAASGTLSPAKAAEIARAADGDEAVASSLLSEAERSSVEQIRRRGQGLNASKQSLSQRQRLRRSQFIRVERKGAFVRGEYCLLAENASAFLEADRKTSGTTSWERAESFASQLGAKTSKPRVVFHMDLTTDFDIGERVEQVGVGPVSKLAVFDIIRDASFALVGRMNNKLVWFDETDHRSAKVDLPEFIKRAVRESQWSICANPGCHEPVDEIDHVTARTSGGGHDPTNLQGLCKRCHDQKTRQDAPWTAGGIYGPDARWRKQKVPRDGPEVDELFPDLN